MPSDDPLADLMDSSWGLSSPPSASQSGKLGGAVGGFPGLPAANQARVGLLCLVHKDVETSFCGAPIGRGGKKMCTKVGCDVVAHRRTKVTAEDFGGVGELAFICVPPSTGKLGSTSVFLSPRIPTAAFNASLERYLMEEKTVDQWTSLFASLEATPNPTAEETDIIAGRFDEALPGAAYTPRGKLGKRKAESPSVSDLETDFEYVESTFDTRIPTRLSGGTDLARDVHVLTQHWGTLVDNTLALLRLAQMTHGAGQEKWEKAEMGLADVEFATSLLATKVGDRPQRLGTESVFQLIEGVVEETGKLREDVDDLGSPENLGAREAALTLRVGRDVINHLSPIFQLFQTLSSSKHTPGDILEERLRKIEAGRAATTTTGGGTPSNPWATHPLTAASSPVVGVGSVGGQPGIQDMAERIKVLEGQLKEMQDEMTVASVQIGTATFTSRSQVQSWMDMNRCPPKACIFFLDALSMLALMHSGSESAKSAAEFASITKKVGYDTVDEALVVTSFSLEVPEAFGTLPRSGIARDSRVLPGLPTFREWDGGDGYLGLKVELANKLNEFMSPMGEHYRSCLAGEGLIVAIEMLAGSKLFISDLSTWINTTYQDTRARTMASEAEAWSLISHCVRVVFKLLRDARSSGARWTTETRDVKLVWAQMQCHRVMEELRVAQFSAHPALSHVLNLHLQDNVVSRSKYEALEKRVLEVERIAVGAKKAADKAAGGGGGGGGGGAAGGGAPRR